MTSAERAKELLYRMSAEAWIPDDTHVDWERRVSQAIDAAVAEALPRWVPVTERLPESPDDMVLVTYTWAGKSRVCAACYDSDDRHWNAGEWSIGDVVAWQPLPAPWVAP